MPIATKHAKKPSLVKQPHKSAVKRPAAAAAHAAPLMKRPHAAVAPKPELVALRKTQVEARRALMQKHAAARREADVAARAAYAALSETLSAAPVEVVAAAAPAQ